MCGFSGSYFFNGSSSKKLIKSISLDHRGPDDHQIFKNDFVEFNFFRLKILGGSYGKQPMISENKRWMIVFNGEIYNYIEIAKKIKRSDLIKKGDTRVLLELISLKGVKAIKETNGMFSIALFDLKSKKIFLIRDRFGIKPLYYKVDKNFLNFSSEIKSLQIDKNQEINMNVLNHFLESELYPKKPKTFFKNIFEIEPGTINEFKKNKLSTTKYYSLKKNIKKLENKNINLKEFEDSLEKSIKLRLRSDVPISLHFSGGIDSTALLCKLKEIYGDNLPIKIFILKYKNRLSSDLIRARKICKILKLKLNEINFKNSNFKRIAKEVQFFMDEPFGGVPLLGSAILNKHQKKIPVSLEGQGSDEIFAGYYTHIIMALRDMMNKKKDLKIFKELKKKFKLSDKNIIKVSDNLLKNNFGGSTDNSKRIQSKEKIKFEENFLRTIEYFNLKINKLPRVLRFHDRVSAGYSRELRFPFLDHNVVEKALSLKNEDKFKYGIIKYPLQQIIKRHLPLNLFSNEKTSDLVPQLEIFKSNKNWCQKNLDELEKKNIILKKYFISAKRTFSKKNVNSFHLWQLINLNLFFENLKKLKKFYQN